MPKGPNGQKRPADVIGAAVMVGRIATGEIEESTKESSRIKIVRADAGQRGGAARSASLTPNRKTEIARKGAVSRWAKPQKEDAPTE